MSRTVPVRALELCLECISILLRAGWGGGLAPELSGQLLILLTFMAKPSSAENGIPGTSEELQTTALKCLAELLLHISRIPQGRQALTATANIPALGEAVLVTLDSLTDSNSNGVKLQALAAITALITAIDDKDALASFLPRMVSSLTKVLTPSSSNRASFRVLEHGLKSMTSLFLRLLSDRETKSLSQTTQEDPQDKNKVIRSASWLHATASQIKIALANVLKLRNHDKPEVRQALLNLCLTVVQDCRISLSECVSMVIETMVTLAGRAGPEDAVETHLKILLATNQKLSGLLRESLHGWVISLPRLMQSKDDTGRRQIIHQISVTLRLLKEDQVMVDDLLAENLRDGVSAIFNDSKGAESLVEVTSAAALGKELVLGQATSTSFEPLRLRFKGQEDMMAEFRLLIGELAKSDTAITVAQELVNGVDIGSQEKRLASFWIAVNLVRDIMTSNPAIDDFIDLGGSNPQEEVLDNLYSHSLDTLGLQGADTVPHWHFQALALEVIALQAMRHKADFRAELGETLYPVLHHLGSPNPGLRNHAITCLNIMAESCAYESASEMVIANVDYIVNTVGLKLSYGDVSPQAPQVLLMMMRLCGPSLLPYLDDLVGSIFGALERYHGYPRLVELLFAVLKGMTEEGVKAPQLAITAAEDQSTKEQKRDEIAYMLEILETVKKQEAKALKRDEELPKGSFPRQPWGDPKKSENEELTQDEDQPADDTPSKEPPPPAPHIFTILLKISELTQHYLTSSSPSLRTSLLSLLHTTIPALAKHENSFLPLINTLWPVLVPRLEDPEAYVVANALDIVALMCEHAGNFMKSRIEAAWSLLKAIHRRTVKRTDNRFVKSRGKPTSLLISPTSTSLTKAHPIDDDLTLSRPELYVDAPTRMIWDALVRLLCAVSQHVGVQEKYFDEILDMLDPVLGDANVRKALERRSPEAVWLRLYKKSQLEEERKGNGGEWAVLAGIEELRARRRRMEVRPEWEFVEV